MGMLIIKISCTLITNVTEPETFMLRWGIQLIIKPLLLVKYPRTAFYGLVYQLKN